MDTAMEEKRGTYTALSLSLALHVILLLAAGALGLFSIAAPQDAGTPVEVTLYDAGPAAADAGDAAPAAAVSAVSDVVIVDKRNNEWERGGHCGRRRDEWNVCTARPAGRACGGKPAGRGKTRVPP